MRVLVLSGGESAEREVSLESGSAVAAALTSMGHDVSLVDPADTDVTILKSANWDIAFPMVHGTGGEDGKLQRQLDQIGLHYVGSSATASELTFDKIRTNTLLKSHGIAVPDCVVLTRKTSPDENLNAVIQQGLPVVIKPPRQGSSIGVSIVQDAAQIASALTTAFRYDHECMVETFIPGHEVTIPVIDGVPYPAIEIRPASGWYDYDSKYVDDQTEYIVAPPDQLSAVSKTAVRACELCNVSGIVRVDFRVDMAGSPWLLEINTIPGMTSHSLVPKSAASRNQSLGELCNAVLAGCPGGRWRG